ncbi:nuclear transport factor 2 family protein [Phreatobacter stygius]|uniref:Nuclear transport factor 2 family protein n=1 Tax=Phreatobacter stygius TaxID=1940610 RepID=A0A4D7B946_9HYPH|nr:nuclear transport factor 2 family protein [Phreatobacter stygius]QCI66748.1 nuclear transport factor 2 family protein [Phreatobacter stygius]
MTNPSELADRYIAMWNETDASARRKLVAEIWAPDAHFADPVAAGRGHDQIDAVLAGVQQQFAGLSFSLTGKPDGFGDNVRLSWQLAAGDGPAVVKGTDIGRVTADGRLASVVGFFDLVPG